MGHDLKVFCKVFPPLRSPFPVANSGGGHSPLEDQPQARYQLDVFQIRARNSFHNLRRFLRQQVEPHRGHLGLWERTVHLGNKFRSTLRAACENICVSLPL